MWQNFTTENILEMLKVMDTMASIQCGHCQRTTLSMISQWLSVNVHILTEQQLLALVVSMDKMDFINSIFIHTLERYMKVRGIQIKEIDLVAAICDYCDHQCLRSLPILEASGEYFIEHAKSLNPPQINSIVKVFGRLNVHPPNGFKFWDIVEPLLKRKFAEFPPEDLINLFMSFIYLEKFPLNLISRVFTSNFFESLETRGGTNSTKSKAELDLIRAAMKMETSAYLPGGYIFNKSQYLYQSPRNKRIYRMCLDLLGPLGNIVGDVKRITQDELLIGASYNALYRVDMMIYPSVTASLLKLEVDPSKNNKYVAILIHPPDHYDHSQQHLIGRQVMRSRHISKMGYKVMHVKYSDVAKLLVVPRSLQDYLKKQYDIAVGKH